MKSLYFQEDSTPAHHARDTIELVQCTTSDFAASDMWPPILPNLNPVDYVTWSVIQQRVYETKVHDIDEPATASTACVVQLGAVAD